MPSFHEMVSIERLPGEKFTSNCYIISDASAPAEIYLIDAGCISGLRNALDGLKSVRGVFLTHAHYDHIHDLKVLQDRFPSLSIYCSEFTQKGLRSSKINLSFYHEAPIEFVPENVALVGDQDSVMIFGGEKIEVLETPGHDPGSLTFKYGKYFFTGDALIPNVPVVTKLKTGNKVLAKESIRKLRYKIKEGDWICPGHLEMCVAGDVNWELYL